MHFDSRILRPPYEARSEFLQVTKGCSHNKCNFCIYYKDVDFNLSSTDEIREDLKQLRSKGYAFKRIWLQSADPFTLPFGTLKSIANLIHEYLPFVETIGCYSRVDSLMNKSVSQLKILKELGYESIVFGVESGDDNLLNNVNKGYKSKEIVEQLSKMDKAKLNYTLIFLGGLGGHGYGNTHATKTAKLFNKLNPKRVMILGLTLFGDSKLMGDVREGKFIEADEKERILELRTFIEELDINTFIDATNASIVTPFFGRIPDNKEAIVDYLCNAYEGIDEKVLKKKRNNIKHV